MSLGLLKLREIIREKLNADQLSVLSESNARKSGIFALHLGFGKTRTSLALALEYGYLVAVIVSKSLVSSWQNEINKVFGNKVRVSFIASETSKQLKTWHPIITEGEGDDSWSIPHIVLITPEYLSLKYKKVNPHFTGVVRSELVDRWRQVVYYDTVTHPTLPESTVGPLSIFSVTWDCLIIDEVQDYCNIGTPRTRTICSIAAKHRWALSATPIRNPKPLNIMGLFCLIDEPSPRCIEELVPYYKSDNFGGFNRVSIVRHAKVPTYKVVDTIVTHGMFKEEVIVYTMFRRIVKEINKELELAVNTEDKARLGASLLAVVGYMRQAISSPVLPIASIAISCVDTNVNTISNKLNDEINRLGIHSWLDDESSVFSSRTKCIIENLEKNKDERIIVFFANRTSVDLFRHFVKYRETFTISSTMSSKKRGEILTKFEATNNGVLVLTYTLGSQGLNLQSQRIVFLAELDWSDTSTKQAIGRVNRPGQEKDVFVYRFTSGTGVEHILLNKQLKKSNVSSELMVGKATTSLTNSEFRNMICNIINSTDNVKIIQRLQNK